MQYVTFRLHDTSYGIPICLVQEFTRSLDISPIIGQDERIAGMVNLRGRVVIVIDLKKCLQRNSLVQSQKNPEMQNKKMIILEAAGQLSERAKESGIQAYTEPLVLLVDQIDEVITVKAKDLHPPPGNVPSPSIEGVVKRKEGLLCLLSIHLLAKELQEDNLIEKH